MENDVPCAYGLDEYQPQDQVSVGEGVSVGGASGVDPSGVSEGVGVLTGLGGGALIVAHTIAAPVASGAKVSFTQAFMDSVN